MQDEEDRIVETLRRVVEHLGQLQRDPPPGLDIRSMFDDAADGAQHPPPAVHLQTAADAAIDVLARAADAVLEVQEVAHGAES